MKLAKQYQLQKQFYREIRERFNLSAQFAIRVISKAVEAYKRDKSRRPHFKLNGAIQYDQRNLSWKGIDRVSLITLEGPLLSFYRNSIVSNIEWLVHCLHISKNELGRFPNIVIRSNHYMDFKSVLRNYVNSNFSYVQNNEENSSTCRFHFRFPDGFGCNRPQELRTLTFQL